MRLPGLKAVLPVLSLRQYSQTALYMSSSERGAFILFEGGDRCGKSTQTKRLEDNLAQAGVAVEGIRYPNRTSTIGQMINNYLASEAEMDDRTIHLLFSANRWEASKMIQTRLEEGCTLICDRYAYSGAAFTSAKGYDLEWCKNPDRGLPKPDAIIFLDMPIEEAAKRGDFGGERYEKIDFQKSVKEQYMKLKEQDEGGTEPFEWNVIDANQTIEAVEGEVRKVVDAVRERVKGTPIGTLWTD